MSERTYYTILGISETATQDEIDRAYQSVAEAYWVLSDSTERSSYDQQLAQRRQYSLAPKAPPGADLTCPLYPEVFSKRMGCSIATARDLLAGRLPISPALAHKLQAEFGWSVEFWMSQPFEQESINHFAVLAVIVFFISLGYLASIFF
jgi:curved DNA-binding protein CbpA